MRAVLHLGTHLAREKMLATPRLKAMTISAQQNPPQRLSSADGKTTCSTNQPPQSATRTSGPLAGFRIVEFAGIGPGPFACMMLADMGAEVVTLDRVGAKKNLKSVAGRGRKVVELDLKDKAAIAQVLDLLAMPTR